jgi:O-antigen ligase
MRLPALNIRSGQRWCIIAAIVLIETVLWVNTVESGIAKQPIFVLSAALVVSIFFAECILTGKVELSFSAIDILIALHLPLFIFWALLAYDPVYTWGAFAFGSSCIIFFYAGSSLFPSRKEVHLLFKYLEWLTFLLCVIAAIQYFLGDQLAFNFYIPLYGRVSSLLGHSTFFSAYLIILFPVLLGQALFRRSQGAHVLLHTGLLAVMVFFLFATQTRSSILGWIVSIAAFALIAPSGKKLKRAVLVMGMIVAAICLYSTIIQPDIARQFVSSVDEGRGSTLARRMYFWAAGRNAFVAAPVFGHGIGSFERATFEYRSPDYWKAHSEDIVPHAHNEVIEIAVEYGSVGILLFIATFALVLYRGIHLARISSGWKSWTAAGLSSSLIAIAIDNLAGVSLRQATTAVVVWLLMGLLWSSALAMKNKKTLSAQLRLPAYAALIPILCWLLFAFHYVKSQTKEFESSTHLLRALEYGNQNSPEAITECQIAVAENPDNLHARLYLIEAYARAGKWNDAVLSVEKLQYLSPAYPKSSLVKAYALFQLGRYPEALENIQIELQRRSHPEAFLLESSIYHALLDESGEKTALINLLKKIIDSKIVYAYQNACARLVELSRLENEKKELAACIDSLEAIDPAGKDFLESEKLKLQTGTNP